MPNEISRQPRAILFTSPAPGEPSTEDQYDQLAEFAESSGFDAGWDIAFGFPIPGRQMVSPTMLKSLPEEIDVVCYVDHGRPVAYPVRPAKIRN